MNMNQFTQKSLAAIQGAQDIALPPSSTSWRSCPGSPVEAGRRTRSMWLRTWTVP